MSKITEAINRAQKEFAKALDEVIEAERKADDSLFIKEPLTDLRTGFKKRDSFGQKISKSKPIIVVALFILCFTVFVFGVRQGKKIDELQEEVPSSESHFSDSEEQIPGVSFAVDDSGKAIMFTNGQWIDYAAQEADAQIPFENIQVKEGAKDFEKEWSYTIQLVTYSDLNRAEEERVRLDNQGFNSFVIPSESHFQVVINRFEDSSSATQFLRSLDPKFLRKYQGAYVRLIKRR